MQDPMYELAEGIDAPAEYADDISRWLDAAGVADVMATSAAQALDQANIDLIAAQGAVALATARYEAAASVHEDMDRKLREVLKAAGLVRTAAGIMPKAQAIAALPGLAIVPADGAGL